MDKAPFDPIHPAEFVREDWMKLDDMSVESVASALQLPVTETERFLREEHGVTPDFAVRLSQGLGCSVAFWLGLQKQFEDDVARKAGRMTLMNAGTVAAE